MWSYMYILIENRWVEFNSIVFIWYCMRAILYTLLKKRMECQESCTSQNLWIFFSIYFSITIIKRLKWDENTYKLPLAVRQNGRSLFTLPWLMYCIKISKYTIYMIMLIGNLSFVQTPFLRILLVVNGRNVKMHYFCLAVIAFLQDFNLRKLKKQNWNQ